MGKRFKNIGFVSTRIAGTDGVSLEIEKWAAVLERNDYECFYFAGLLDRPAERSFLVEEAFFDHPDIQLINENCVHQRTRTAETTELIYKIKDQLKEKLYEFINYFDIDLLIPENALAIPMNVPLGLALTELIAETNFPTIAHHHDFYWERNRYLINAFEDFLQMAFPPDLKSIQHVVINSLAGIQLSHRKGISNTLIPNVYDFANPPGGSDTYCRQLRKTVGLGPEDLFILQPTRVVPRKWIERAIEIVAQLKLSNPTLVISHASGDEGDLYQQRIREYADNLGVRLEFIDHLVGPRRVKTSSGQRIYTIGDVYRCADLVTYPSGYEGFGNAFLETIYYQKPIVVNRYSIYIADIEPKGFDVISFDGFVSSETIDKIREVLNDPKRKQHMVETNYELARQFFSYEVLERKLLHLIDEAQRI
ncbi:MAG: glycosyltransferase family 1 protein [Calditrichaeota bacterium]|nr:MAG: glycosyltransferase family 1 protein [Calditrichota bacterium]